MWEEKRMKVGEGKIYEGKGCVEEYYVVRGGLRESGRKKVFINSGI